MIAQKAKVRMNHIYDNRKQAQSPAQLKETTAQQPSPEALRSGAVKPTREQMGHRVDLPDAMRAKMENAFGADFSAVAPSLTPAQAR